MIKNKWRRFVTNNYSYSPEDLNYRRVYLLNSILAVGIFVSLSFVILNILIFTSIYLVLLTIVASTILTAILMYFHRNRNLETTAFISVLLFILIFVIYFNLKEYKDYALLWVTVIPPVTYFLLGRKRGRMVITGFFIYMVLYIVKQYPIWLQGDFTSDSIYNISIASLAIVAIVGYFEMSREEAFEALKNKNEELVKISTMDSLTGLNNRFRLDQLLDYEVNRGERSNDPLAVILGDLDKFKYVNDSFGHIAGDKLLIEVANIIKSSCRETDIIGRWGGEEFLIICPATDLQGAVTLAEKVRRNIAEHYFQDVGQITISLGVAFYFTGDTREEIIKKADQALYHVKNNGRNGVHY